MKNTDPMVVGIFWILWNEDKGKFQVTVQGKGKVLHSNELGKECFDWAVKKLARPTRRKAKRK